MLRSACQLLYNIVYDEMTRETLPNPKRLKAKGSQEAKRRAKRLKAVPVRTRSLLIQRRLV